MVFGLKGLYGGINIIWMGKPHYGNKGMKEIRVRRLTKKRDVLGRKSILEKEA